jgi:hypothetical protein
MDAATEERVRTIIRNNPDWDFVLQTSVRHGVDMLLYRSLRHLNSEEIPSFVCSRLREYARGNVTNCLFLTGQLLAVLELFYRSGIEAIPFKGPTLAVLAYGDVTLRRFDDLDIMIQRKDFPKTKDLLIANGFRPWRNLEAVEEATHVASEHAFTFVSDDKKLAIDLHWDLLQRQFAVLDAEMLWKRLAPFKFARREVLSLKTEDLLLYLCLHGAKHGWKRLGWICDVAALIHAQPTIDWGLVWNEAKRLRCRRMLLVGLCLARETLGADPPDTMSNRFDRRTLATVLQVRNSMFAETSPYREVVSQIVFHSKMRERWRDRIPYFQDTFHRFLQPGRKERDLFALPRAFVCLYYFSRPLRLIAIFGYETAASIFRRH